MDQYTQLSIERFPDGVALVKLNDPPLNLLNPTMLAELQKAFDEMDRDDTMRAVVLTGSQRAFCAGWNVMTRLEKDGNDLNIGQICNNRIESSRLPVIAAIDGHCYGGGLELALACDIRFAAEEAKIGLTEANFSLTAAFGGNTRLPWLIGEANAKRMIYTAAKLSGAEALRYGVVQEVYPSTELVDKALELAHLIATKAPRTITVAKATINGYRGDDFAVSLNRENTLCHYASRSEDSQEGKAAMREKRQPKFQNR